MVSALWKHSIYLGETKTYTHGILTHIQRKPCINGGGLGSLKGFYAGSSRTSLWKASGGRMWNASNGWKNELRFLEVLVSNWRALSVFNLCWLFFFCFVLFFSRRVFRAVFRRILTVLDRTDWTVEPEEEILLEGLIKAADMEVDEGLAWVVKGGWEGKGKVKWF